MADDMKKATVTASVRLNAYALIARAVEEGIAYGYQRAHKYVDKPDRETLIDNIEQHVMNALCEVLMFDEVEGE